MRFSGDQSKAAAVYEGMKPLSAEDIADVIVWVALRPAHVNINQIELMPVEQSWSPSLFTGNCDRASGCVTSGILIT